MSFCTVGFEIADKLAVMKIIFNHVFLYLFDLFTVCAVATIIYYDLFYIYFVLYKK